MRVALGSHWGAYRLATNTHWGRIEVALGTHWGGLFQHVSISAFQRFSSLPSLVLWLLAVAG
jgi:hypothetical protein